jgi:NodT family efflux transporter outer membrane factor (OMF) lipoprotein
MLLTSCATRKLEVQQPEFLPESFSIKGETPLPDKWWTELGDSGLNALIDKALDGNFSLRAAWDRLDQARSIAAREGADLWPSLEGTASASRTRTVSKSVPAMSTTPSGTVQTGTKKDTTYSNNFTLGLLASYELDLWGRIRSARQAALLDVQATEEDLQTAAITLTAEIANVWYRLVEQYGQLKLLDEQIETNEKQLEVITLRFRRGLAEAPDVLQQKQLVESRRGERILVTSTIETLKHLLAVLVGQAPGTMEVEVPGTLPELPPLPETGFPAEWIRKRPDIYSSELRIRAADKRLGEAIANQFPRVSISVSANSSQAEFGDLFDDWASTLAGNLVAPLFEGGARRAEVRRTRAVVAETLNSYNQLVLDSLQEVEDALTQEMRQAEYLESLRTQLDLSRMSTDQVLDRYIKGTLDFTRYLTTLASYQNLQRTGLQGELNLVQYRIDLYRSLAGGWELTRPLDEENPQKEYSGDDIQNQQASPGTKEM